MTFSFKDWESTFCDLYYPYTTFICICIYICIFFKGVAEGDWRKGGLRMSLHCSLNFKTRRLSRGLKHQRFWATYANRKWAFFSYYMPWRCQICVAKFLCSYRDDLVKKFVQNRGSSVQKVYFRLTCVAQKRRCLNSLLIENDNMSLFTAVSARDFVIVAVSTNLWSFVTLSSAFCRLFYPLNGLVSLSKTND